LKVFIGGLNPPVGNKTEVQRPTEHANTQTASWIRKAEASSSPNSDSSMPDKQLTMILTGDSSWISPTPLSRPRASPTQYTDVTYAPDVLLH
jgi:hypothetical protein